MNKVRVEYTRVFNGKAETFDDTYDIYASPMYGEAQGLRFQKSAFPRVKPVKVDPKFKDRLYLLNNAADLAGKAAHMVWNNPMGGALEWSFYPQNGIVDTTGEYRWYLFAEPIYDVGNPFWGGDMMGFRQTADAPSPGATGSATSSTTSSGAKSTTVDCLQLFRLLARPRPRSERSLLPARGFLELEARRRQERSHRA